LFAARRVARRSVAARGLKPMLTEGIDPAQLVARRSVAARGLKQKSLVTKGQRVKSRGDPSLRAD